jgi:glycosyltransferase involved in cell wall biosynthesis
MKNKIDISIIIPTYINKDRDHNLCNLLIALRGQKKSNYNFEVILVNNYNFSISEEAVKRFKGYIDEELRIIEDPVIGLSHARNSGVLNSRGEIIAFLDDDVIPSNDWLNSLIEAHKKYNALCIGGPVVFKKKKLVLPRWFNDYYLRFLLPPKFPRYSCKITKPFYLIGANMSFKRNAFKKYGLFDESLGRKGTCLLSGEDTEFIIRFEPDDIFFESRALVFSEIKSDRISHYFFIKRIFWQAVSEARIVKKHGIFRLNDKSELVISKTIIKDVFQLLKEANFFQAFCVIFRFITFKLALLLRL